MRPTIVIAITALLVVAPASAARGPKHANHHKHTNVTHSGKLVKRTASSVTVKDGDHDVTCSRTDSSPDLGGAKVGKDVKIKCQDGVLVAFEHVPSGTAVGTISALSTTSLTVHNDERDATCTLDDSSPRLGDFHVGDRVKLACTSGVLTAIAKLDAPPADDDQTVVGTLSAFSDASITVHAEGGDVTCARGDGSPKLGDFHVGDRVKVACTNGVLTTIAKLDVTTITTGLLTGFSDGNLVVTGDGGAKTCARGASSPSPDGFRVGDQVEMTCLNGVLTALAHADVVTDGSGTISALSSASLTVHGAEHDLTCSLTGDSPVPTQFHVGDAVKAYCRNGVLAAIARVEVTPPPAAPVTGAGGTLSALAPSSLTVHTDGGDVTCSRGSTSPSLDGYTVGNHVKMTCTAGVLTTIQHL